MYADVREYVGEAERDILTDWIHSVFGRVPIADFQERDLSPLQRRSSDESGARRAVSAPARQSA